MPAAASTEAGTGRGNHGTIRTPGSGPSAFVTAAAILVTLLAGTANAQIHPWTAVGSTGSFESKDDGATWKQFDRENYNSVAFTKAGEGWAVGPKSRVVKFAK